MSEAKRLGLKGETTIEVQVGVLGTGGYLAEARVAESSGIPILDRAAMYAVRYSTFAPGSCNGRPVPVAETWSDERWRVEVAGQVVRDEANPYGWIPYVVLPNGTRPGRGGWGHRRLVRHIRLASSVP